MPAISNRSRSSVAAAAFAILAGLAPSGGWAAPSPEAKCEAGKNDAAGKYAACVAKAEKGLVATGDTVKYAATLSKCEGKILASWSKLEAAATAAATSCPSMGDAVPIEGFVAACAESVAVAVAGGTLGPDPITCASDLAACDGDLATCDGDLASCESDLATSESDLLTCDGDLTVCQASTSRIPKSGQVTCTDDAGTVIPCAGSGRDGEYQAGDAPNFVDNGNGTITDNLTGLMWEKLSDDGSIHDKDLQFAGLTAAIGKAASLNGAAFAGYTDWRVPNVRELGTLPDYELSYSPGPAVPSIFRSPCTPGCSVLTCSCTKSNVYITSTTYAGYPMASWKYNMQDGDMYAGNKTDSHYVRLVRTAH